MVPGKSELFLESCQGNASNLSKILHFLNQNPSFFFKIPTSLFLKAEESIKVSLNSFQKLSNWFTKTMQKARNVNDYWLERNRLQTYRRTIWIKARCSQNKSLIYQKVLSTKNWLKNSWQQNFPNEDWVFKFWEYWEKSPNCKYLLILGMQFFFRRYNHFENNRF